MKGQLPTFQIIFHLGPLSPLVVAGLIVVVVVVVHNHLMIYTFMLRLLGSVVLLNVVKKGEVCSRGKLLKLGLDAKKNYYLLSIIRT